MTVFDYVMLAILALSAAVGTWRGLVSEIFALLAWVAAILAAWLYADVVAELFNDLIVEAFWRQVAAWASIFVAVLLLAALLRFLLRELLRVAGLGPVDRFFGTLFGLARGLAIVFVLVLVGGLIGMANQPWWRDALLAPPLETAVIASKPWLPGGVAEKIRFR